MLYVLLQQSHQMYLIEAFERVRNLALTLSRILMDRQVVGLVVGTENENEHGVRWPMASSGSSTKQTRSATQLAGLWRLRRSHVQRRRRDNEKSKTTSTV